MKETLRGESAIKELKLEKETTKYCGKSASLPNRFMIDLKLKRISLISKKETLRVDIGIEEPPCEKS